MSVALYGVGLLMKNAFKTSYKHIIFTQQPKIGRIIKVLRSGSKGCEFPRESFGGKYCSQLIPIRVFHKEGKNLVDNSLLELRKISWVNIQR